MSFRIESFSKSIPYRSRLFWVPVKFENRKARKSKSSGSLENESILGILFLHSYFYPVIICSRITLRISLRLKSGRGRESINLAPQRSHSDLIICIILLAELTGTPSTLNQANHFYKCLNGICFEHLCQTQVYDYCFHCFCPFPEMWPTLFRCVLFKFRYIRT